MSRSKTLAAPIFGALAAGLGLFFVLESAVARRVGADLFLPAAAGAFLPGRLARMAAALVLCFALALTERGRALRRRLDKVCQSVWGCWAVSAVITALLVVWTLRVTVLSFLISDDAVAMKAIASMPEQGMIAGTHTFSNVLFCALLSLFYKLDPGGYWYTYYHMGMQILVLWILGWCLLQKTTRRGWPALAGCALYGVFCAGVFSYTFGALTFTLTSAMTGTGAVILALCRDERKTRLGRIGSDVCCILLLLLCRLQRSSCGDALFCFWALAIGYQVIKTLLHREQWVRRTAVLLLVAMAAVTLPGKVASLAPVEAGSDYRQSEAYRSLVEDFLIDHMTDEHFAAVGYPPELVPLLRYWFFMDRRVTTKSFAKLARIYYRSLEEDAAADPPAESADPAAAADAAPAADTAAPAVTEAPEAPAEPSFLAVQARRALSLSREFVSLIRADALMLQLALLILALLGWVLAAFWRSGLRRWLETLIALCAVGGSFLMSLYLIESAYFPLRAFQVIAFPATTTILLCLVSGPGEKAGGRERQIGAGALWLAGAAAVGALCCAGVYLMPHATVPDTRADLFSAQWEAEAYAHANPDVTIINNAYFLIFDPLHSAQDYPDNLVWWGACGDLAKPEEERLYAEAFFRDDVQFMTQNPASVSFLMQYLTLDYGPVQIVNTLRLNGGINIYDVDQVRPAEENYTGWYEQNGLTYYFVNGQALTGVQVIDGKEYTFAPIGASCQFSAQFTDDALVYTTDAYSLITEE